MALPEPAVRLALAQEVSCAILSSGRVYCWGEGQDGILGNGSSNDHATPTEVLGLDAIADVDLEGHACAARGDGSLACWGADVFLETGGTSEEHFTPVNVPGITDVVDVAVGFWYTCALTRDQEIYCWGANSNHELGLGDSSPFWVYTPTRVDWRAALPPEN